MRAGGEEEASAEVERAEEPPAPPATEEAPAEAAPAEEAPAEEAPAVPAVEVATEVAPSAEEAPAEAEGAEEAEAAPAQDEATTAAPTEDEPVVPPAVEAQEAPAPPPPPPRPPTPPPIREEDRSPEEQALRQDSSRPIACVWRRWRLQRKWLRIQAEKAATVVQRCVRGRSARFAAEQRREALSMCICGGRGGGAIRACSECRDLFHAECVGAVNAPAGRWICPDCHRALVAWPTPLAPPASACRGPPPPLVILEAHTPADLRQLALTAPDVAFSHANVKGSQASRKGLLEPLKLSEGARQRLERSKARARSAAREVITQEAALEDVVAHYRGLPRRLPVVEEMLRAPLAKGQTPVAAGAGYRPSLPPIMSQGRLATPKAGERVGPSGPAAFDAVAEDDALSQRSSAPSSKASKASNKGSKASKKLKKAGAKIKAVVKAKKAGGVVAEAGG